MHLAVLGVLWLSLLLPLPHLLAAAASRLTPRHTAYLRVAEGCNHACTFCAIPGFRGKFRSKAWGAVLDEAARLVASGVVELNLIAEDTNQYGQDRCADRQALGAA
jgi:ribosomal protein S12 methylthiotransferase